MALIASKEEVMKDFDLIIDGIKALKEAATQEKKTNYEKLNDAYEVLKGLRDNLVEEKRLEDAGHIVHTLELIQEEQTEIIGEGINIQCHWK
jgi:hypothetical protein